MSQNDFPMIIRLHPLAMFALLARTVLTYQPEKNVFGNMTTEGSYPSDTAHGCQLRHAACVPRLASPVVALLDLPSPGGNPGLAGVGRKATV